MKKLRQNKPLIILLLISVVLVGTSGFISLLGYSSYIRSAFGVIFTPIQRGATSLFENITSSIGGDEARELREENEALKDRIFELEKKISQADRAIEENDRLREYLSIKSDNLSLEFEECRVIGREPVNLSTVYTLDKGTYHGLKTGMPVITEKGLVGRIYEVGYTFSKVILVTDDRFSVGVYVDRSGESGILSGRFDPEKNNEMTLSGIDEEADIKEGDFIYTSATGENYPSGLFVGKVTNVYFDSYSREKRATVVTDIDFDTPGRVMVITSYENIHE